MNVVYPEKTRFGYQVSITGLFFGWCSSRPDAGYLASTVPKNHANRRNRFIGGSRTIADRIDSKFRAVAAAVGVLPQLPLITSGSVTDPLIPPLLAALLRENEQLYNIYVGYDDGSFVEMDALERADPSARNLPGEVEGSVFRLVVIPATRDAEERTRTIAFLDRDLRI